MITYVYRCPACGHTAERRREIRDRNLPVWCRSCGTQRLDRGVPQERMRRIFTPPAVHIEHAA